LATEENVIAIEIPYPQTDLSANLEYRNYFTRYKRSHDFPEAPPPPRARDSKIVPKNLADQMIQLKREVLDNAPWLSSGNYGKNGKPDYYFQDKPNESQLWYQARNSAIGYRLVYGMAKDVYINEFSFRFPNSELEDKDKEDINQQIRIHLREIGYYKESRKCCGFRREQGEALLLALREGDGASYYYSTKSDHPHFTMFGAKTNTEKPILQVQAINKYDYFLPTIGAFGRADNFRVTFYEGENRQMPYEVHPSRVVRWKNDDIDYDQYEQQSALRACFAELQIINMIERAMGFAAHRWGIGVPAFFTKLVSEGKFDKFKAKLGNPLLDDFWILPTEFIEKVEMLGVQGQMIDLSGFMDKVVEVVAGNQQIPTPILLGRVAGVVEGSIVNERQYYNTLIREQMVENEFHRQFFAVDPFVQAIFKKYKVKEYELDWGLRQEMTKKEQADLDLVKASVGISMMNYCFYNEIRQYFGKNKLEENEIFKRECPKYTTLPAEMLGNWIPNMAVFKQAGLREIIETPVEQRAEEQAEQLGSSQNKPTNVSRMQNTGPKYTEEQRQEMKTERKEAGGEQSRENDSVRPRKDKQVMFMWTPGRDQPQFWDMSNPEQTEAIRTADPSELVKQMALGDIQKLIKDGMKGQSINKLAKEAHCRTDTIKNLMNYLKIEIPEDEKNE